LRWQTQSEYFLIDQLHLPKHQLPSADNLAGLLIRIERSENPKEATLWLERLACRLKILGEENFQKSVISWLTHSFLPTRMPNIELQELLTIEQIIMSIENNTMDWSVQYIEQGREEGRVVGRKEGLTIGLQEGKQSGLHEGKVKLIKLVTKLLTRKFGPLPSDLKLKIESTDNATLDRLADALLDLDSLKELEDILK
jgi:flagellar biosynthesis/type III secretory pathway protein FliH